MKHFLVAIIVAVVLGILLSNGQNIEIFVLTITFVFIAWYSLETHKLVVETQESNRRAKKVWAEMVMTNKLSIQPAVIMEYLNAEKLQLRNIGKAAAIHLQVDSLNRNYHFEVPSTTLSNGETLEINLYKISDEGKKKLITNFGEEFATNKLEAQISFDRIKALRRKLTTVVEISNPNIVRVQNKDWGLDNPLK